MLELGSIFAERYRLLESHSEGGTASIYRAFDSDTESVVALKIFTNSTIDPEVINEIWYRESQALDRLRHPHIIELVSAGRDDCTSVRYIALEWLQGETLDERLKKDGQQTWDQFFERYGRPILDALCFAFKSNVTHRDLSVGNIFVVPDGNIKIIDFGQAKIDTSVVGKTVRGWKTIPYCPPEEDSGRYSNTRDVFSLCAIAVRALSGRAIANHDELYEALKGIELPQRFKEPVQLGLSREPTKRPPNILEFAADLLDQTSEVPSDREYVVPIRFVPAVVEKLLPQQKEAEDENPLGDLMGDLNDTVSISELEEGHSGQTRIALETPNYRFVADIDDESQSHIVVVGGVRKRFNIDRLYAANQWTPTITFVVDLPNTREKKEDSKSNIARLYRDFELFLQALKTTGSSKEDIFLEWDRLLNALRYIERTRDAPLAYERPVVRGRRLSVTLFNPEDAEEGQVRTINHNGRLVFIGVIEALEGRACTLQSNWMSVAADTIPNNGELEMDWRQARVALNT